MNKWTPTDVIVLILAITVSLILLSIFGELMLNDIPLTETAAELVAGLVTSVITIISIYVGAKIQQFRNKD